MAVFMSKPDCAIICHSLTDEESFRKVPVCLAAVKSCFGEIPVVIVGVEADEPGSEPRQFDSLPNFSLGADLAAYPAPLMELVQQLQ